MLFSYIIISPGSFSKLFKLSIGNMKAIQFCYLVIPMHSRRAAPCGKVERQYGGCRGTTEVLLLFNVFCSYPQHLPPLDAPAFNPIYGAKLILPPLLSLYKLILMHIKRHNTVLSVKELAVPTDFDWYKWMNIYLA